MTGLGMFELGLRSKSLRPPLRTGLQIRTIKYEDFSYYRIRTYCVFRNTQYVRIFHKISLFL